MLTLLLRTALTQYDGRMRGTTARLGTKNHWTRQSCLAIHLADRDLIEPSLGEPVYGRNAMLSLVRVRPLGSFATGGRLCSYPCDQFRKQDDKNAKSANPSAKSLPPDDTQEPRCLDASHLDPGKAYRFERRSH